MKKKILFISANPFNTRRLRLQKEQQKIQGLLENNEQWEFNSFLANPDDLRNEFKKIKPCLVHFSLHGDKENRGIIIENQHEDKSHLLNAEALIDFLRLFSTEIECVILNACHTKELAAVIAKHIDYVISMDDEITDAAALAFSHGFYCMLADGNRNYAECFKHACNQINVNGYTDEIKKPHFFRKQIPTLGIKKLLANQLIIADEILKQYYIETRSEFHCRDLPLNFDVNDILDELSSLIKPKQTQTSKPPLLKFFDKLFKHVNESTQPKLFEWLEQTYRQLDLTPPNRAELSKFNSCLEATKSDLTDPCYILISFHYLENNTYQVQARIYQDDKYNSIFADDEATYAPSKLEQAVNKCLDELKKKDVANRDLVIELALPYELLNADVNKWQYFDAPLSQDLPVVVRFKDRMDKHIKILGENWQELWYQAQASGASTQLSNASIYLDENQIDKVSSLLEQNKVFFISKFYPQITDNRGNNTLFKLIRPGTSIALWSRCAIDFATLQQHIDELITCEHYQSLPKQFKKLCRTAKNAEITLLWDIPERIPNFKLVSPQ